MNNSLMTDSVHCTGCSACAATCPLHCIQMQQNSEGFYKAVVDSSICVKCGKCNMVCPLQTAPRYSSGLYWGAAITKDKENYKRSASGGAFVEICRSIQELHPNDEIYYFGAAWKSTSTVVHKYVERLEDIVVFQKSKYIQSDVRDTFSEVKKLLKNGKIVVYSGTPCQISGLKNFLGEDSEKLYLIDFICHGVGSPRVFERCLEETEKKQNAVVKSYSFRWKISRGYQTRAERHLSHIEYDSNKTQNIKIDNYNKFFLSQLCLNSSCAENCVFRRKERSSDFTIADFNGFNSIFPDICDARHYSTVIVNSSKARTVIEQLHIHMDILDCQCSDIETFQPCYNSHPKGNRNRDEFFNLFLKGESIDALIQHFNIKFSQSLKGKIADILPYRILFWLKKIKKRRKNR